MPKEVIFISIVQKEFANERQVLASYIREDELLKLYFEENRSNLVTLWCSSSGTDYDTDHVTDYDTAYDRLFINLEYLPHRLLWILEGELSRGEMMERLGLIHRTNFNENYLDPATEYKWIEMTIPDKPKSKKQRYRLTKAGLEIKQKIAHDNK